MQKPNPSPGRAFLRLWLVMEFSYFTLKLIFDLVVMGWIDIRRLAVLEILLLPLGQSVVFWVVTHRHRATSRSRQLGATE